MFNADGRFGPDPVGARNAVIVLLVAIVVIAVLFVVAALVFG